MPVVRPILISRDAIGHQKFGTTAYISSWGTRNFLESKLAISYQVESTWYDGISILAGEEMNLGKSKQL